MCKTENLIRPRAALQGDSISMGSEKNNKLGLLQVFGSVVASFIGVQSNERRERDFKRGRAKDFVVVGIVLTLLFIFLVWGVVQLVMTLAVAR